MLDQLPPPAGRFVSPSHLRLVHDRSAALGRPAPVLDQNQLFLHVRSVGREEGAHLLQYALADGLGQVRISLFARLAARSADPSIPIDPPRPGRLMASVANEGELDDALRVCRGCSLVAFGRLPQGALLTGSARAGALGLDCARARFLKIARMRGIDVSPNGIVGVNDALQLAGLPPVRSPDAALRALGLRQLSLWMDGLG